MNILLLLVAVRPWRVRPAVARLTLVFAALTTFSLEMQAATWWHFATIRTMVAGNAVLALLSLVVWRHRRPFPEAHPIRLRDAVPIAATLALAALTIALNLSLPIEAADQYHLDKIGRIIEVGNLDYDPTTALKVNVLSSVYEMLLADLRLIPTVGAIAMRLHGLWGLWLLVIGIAAVRELLASQVAAAGGHPDRQGGIAGWPWIAMLVVPPVFHQLVLIKNDLFIAIVAMVVLTWIVMRGKTASPQETTWASWLAGFVVAVKLTTMPLLLVMGGALLVDRRRDWRAIIAMGLGVLGGFIAGGLPFTLAENVQTYGSLMPVGDEGNLNLGPGEAITGLFRFVLSAFDMGVMTRRWWPGRGGWGGTFGLPLLWALVVLIWAWRRDSRARRALACATVYFLAFATVFPDADLVHRMMLGPALLLIACAVAVLDGAGAPAGTRTFRIALIPVLVVSAAQIGRSAVLYLGR
jgi:hypothetical protein